MKYKATVTVEFDDDDLAALADAFGVDAERLTPYDTLNGCLDNLDLGCAWIEQIEKSDV